MSVLVYMLFVFSSNLFEASHRAIFAGFAFSMKIGLLYTATRTQRHYHIEYPPPSLPPALIVKIPFTISLPKGSVFKLPLQG